MRQFYSDGALKCIEEYRFPTPAPACYHREFKVPFVIGSYLGGGLCPWGWHNKKIVECDRQRQQNYIVMNRG